MTPSTARASCTKRSTGQYGASAGESAPSDRAHRPASRSTQASGLSQVSLSAPASSGRLSPACDAKVRRSIAGKASPDVAAPAEAPVAATAGVERREAAEHLGCCSGTSGALGIANLPAAVLAAFDCPTHRSPPRRRRSCWPSTCVTRPPSRTGWCRRGQSVCAPRLTISPA